MTTSNANQELLNEKNTKEFRLCLNNIICEKKNKEKKTTQCIKEGIDGEYYYSPLHRESNKSYTTVSTKIVILKNIVGFENYNLIS